jgi:hypothetical protein
VSKPERIGPIAGLLALVLLFVNLVATRESPKPDTPTGKMVTELLDHRNAYVASAALIFAQAVLLLVFAVAIAAVVDRKDSWVGRAASPAGGAASVLAMASAVSLIAAVFTVDHERTGAAWVPIEFHTFFLASTAVPLAAFLLAVGAAAISAGTLHRVLAWASVAIGVGLAFGGLYGFGAEVDGGVFGAVWFVSGVAFFLWIVVTSIRLLRRGDEALT